MVIEERAVQTQGHSEAAILERVVIAGDLAKLTPEHRVLYYRSVCESLGLNPLTKPFQYITLNGKLTLYATRTATDQLRGIKGVSIDKLEHAELEGLYLVTVYGHDRTGRTDSEVGAVPIGGLKGEARANAILKAVTKAKRRLTLSLAGLGWLDETEVGSVPSAMATDVDQETGEIRPRQTLQQQVAARRAEVTTSGQSLGQAEPVGPDAGAVVDPSPHPADTEGQDVEGGSDNRGTDDTPHPAEDAGARAAATDSGTKGSPGTMPAACEATPPDDDPLGLASGGACLLTGTHRMHRNSEGTWPEVAR